MKLDNCEHKHLSHHPPTFIFIKPECWLYSTDKAINKVKDYSSRMSLTRHRLVKTIWLVMVAGLGGRIPVTTYVE